MHELKGALQMQGVRYGALAYPRQLAQCVQINQRTYTHVCTVFTVLKIRRCLVSSDNYPRASFCQPEQN